MWRDGGAWLTVLGFILPGVTLTQEGSAVEVWRDGPSTIGRDSIRSIFHLWRIYLRNRLDWPQLANPGPNWPTLASTGQPWPRLANPGPNWPTLASTGRKKAPL